MTMLEGETDLAVIRVQHGRHRAVLPWGEVDISRISTDGQLRAAVAMALGVPATDLAGAVVVRHVNGNLTVRSAVGFG